MPNVGLIRVSTDAQDTQRQRAEITQWAAKNGEVIDRWAEDKLSRDLSRNRPEFMRLIADVEAGRVDLVVVSEFQRFGVSGPREFFYYSEIFARAGCRLESVAEGDLLREDVANGIQRFFQASASEEEQKKKGINSLSGKRNLFERKAGLQGGATPYGFDKLCIDLQGRPLWRFRTTTQQPVAGVLTTYDAEGKPALVRNVSGTAATPRRSKKCVADSTKLVPSEDYARVELVRDIFDAYTGPVPVSVRHIAHALNARGETNLGNPWGHTSVECILRNEKYVGDYTAFKTSKGRFGEVRDGRVQDVDKAMRDRLRYEAPQVGKRKRAIARPVAEEDRIKATGTHEGIVERAVWDKAQERLANRSTPVGKAVRNLDNPLRGLLVCGTCKQPMWSCSKRGSLLYECQTFSNAEHTGTERTCGRNLVHHAEVLQLIADKLEEVRGILKPEEPEASLAALFLANIPEDADDIPDDLLGNGVSWAGLIEEQREVRQCEVAALETQRTKLWRAKALCDTDEERAFIGGELKEVERALRKAKESVKTDRIAEDSVMMLLAIVAGEDAGEDAAREMDVVGMAREMFASVEVAVEETPYGFFKGKPRWHYRLRPEGCRFNLSPDLTILCSQIVRNLTAARGLSVPVS